MVELMVGVTIGFMLIATLLQIFLGSANTHRFLEAASQVQESGRFALDFLRRDLRMAGFTGCSSKGGSFTVTGNIDPAKHSSVVSNAVAGFSSSTALQGVAYSGGSLPTALSDLGLVNGDVIAGTDVVIIKRASACPGAQVLCHGNSANSSSNGQSCTNGSLKIVSNNSCQIAKNEIVIVSNCVSADVFSVTNAPASTANTIAILAHSAANNLTASLSGTYGSDSAVYRLNVNVYFVGQGASGEPALFRRRLSGNSFINEELVSGAFDLQLKYGVDSDGDQVANYYARTADLAAADWARSVSSRVTVSIRSEQSNVASDSSNYIYNGSTVSDRRLRRDFETTVTMRNRI